MDSEKIPVEYYENEDGFGLKFPEGIEAGELLKIMRHFREEKLVGFAGKPISSVAEK